MMKSAILLLLSLWDLSVCSESSTLVLCPQDNATGSFVTTSAYIYPATTEMDMNGLRLRSVLWEQHPAWHRDPENSTDPDNLCLNKKGALIRLNKMKCSGRITSKSPTRMEQFVAQALWKYMSPVLLFVGTAGNVMTLAVMCQRKLRSSVTSFLLMVLAVSDTVVLHSGLLRHWIRAIAALDVRTASVHACRTHLFVTYWAADFSSWVISVVTLERFVGVFYPFKARLYITRSFVACLLLEIAVALALVNGHFLWLAEVRTFPAPFCRMCGVFEKRHKRFIKMAWPWIDLACMSLIPSCIIFSGNVAIIVRLFHSRIARWQGSTSSSVKLTSRTGNLLSIAFFFLVTTLPIVVYLAMEKQWKTSTRVLDQQFQARIELAWASVNMLLYLNYSANFFLYCLSGSQFRNQLMLLFKRMNKIGPASSHSSSAHNSLRKQVSPNENTVQRKNTGNTMATSLSLSGSSPCPSVREASFAADLQTPATDGEQHFLHVPTLQMRKVQVTEFSVISHPDQPIHIAVTPDNVTPTLLVTEPPGESQSNDRQSPLFVISQPDGTSHTYTAETATDETVVYGHDLMQESQLSGGKEDRHCSQGMPSSTLLHHSQNFPHHKPCKDKRKLRKKSCVAPKKLQPRDPIIRK